jgi:hypothetical protein
MGRAGIPRSVAMRIAGHKTESVYRRYDIVPQGGLHEAAMRLWSLAFLWGRLQAAYREAAGEQPQQTGQTREAATG